ncbi:MAG: hypothetical protein IPL86_02640 [Flavobacteriales bacterium]|nr:hypothetical protein [Flavobacteriales bacterium]
MRLSHILVFSVLLHGLFAQGTWTQLNNFPGGTWYAQASFSIEGKGYVCTGFNGSQNNAQLWEYTPATDTWLMKAMFPGGARQYATGFAIGGKGYITCGWDNVNDIDYHDLWAYDPVSDAWTQKADRPVLRGMRARLSALVTRVTMARVLRTLNGRRTFMHTTRLAIPGHSEQISLDTSVGGRWHSPRTAKATSAPVKAAGYATKTSTPLIR